MCTCTQSKMRETPEYSTYQCKTAGKYAFVRKTGLKIHTTGF